jgi:mono/diheme cytochrome c family protein
MSDLSAAAAALGVSEAIVKRSAEARANATGASVDDVLKAWAGGAAAPAAPVTSPQPPDASPTSLQPPVASPQPEPVSTSTGMTPVPTGDRRLETGSSAPPAPTQVSPKEALRFPVVVTVPTSGLAERTVSSIPKWLASLFIIIPMFGLLQLAGATTNDCGDGGELLADRVTGTLINCDGTPFEGRGEIGGGTDFIALGEQTYRGQVVAAANCQGCHGAQGQGGSGPPLGTVIATFSSCVDHIEWVSKGTAGFQAEGRATYGDLNKPVGGVGNMPSFANQLSAEQIAAVVAVERVRFGGAAPDQVLVDCGLAEPPASEGAPTDTTEPGTAGTTDASTPTTVGDSSSTTVAP